MILLQLIRVRKSVSFMDEFTLFKTSTHSQLNSENPLHIQLNFLKLYDDIAD